VGYLLRMESRAFGFIFTFLTLGLVFIGSSEAIASSPTLFIPDAVETLSAPPLNALNAFDPPNRSDALRANSGGWLGGSLEKISDQCKNPGTTNLCLTALLGFRCKQLSLFMPFLPGNTCALSGSIVPRVLDITRFKVKLLSSNGGEVEYNLPVIYTEKLLSLIQDKKVQLFLEELSDELRLVTMSEKPFSLFSFTLRYAGTSEKTIEWLAVLFQDTSWVRLQHRFLESRLLGENSDASNVDPDLYRTLLRLGECLDFLQPEEMHQSGSHRYIKLYPENAGDTSSLNVLFYHYYPMAYLSQEMLRRGNSVKMSFFLSYLFNAEYEFQTLDSARWPLQVPRPFKFNESEGGKLKDLYGGYLGALYGVKRVSKGTFNGYAKEFSTSPAWHLRRLMFAMPQ
jgi:hypothetical protein